MEDKIKPIFSACTRIDDHEPLESVQVTEEQGQLEQKSVNSPKRKRQPKVLHQKIIKWLTENFEVDQDSTISRESLYSDYAEWAKANGFEVLNCQSFARILRSIFPKTTTKRIGIQGLSQYHYTGLQLKSDSSLVPHSHTFMAMNSFVKPQKKLTQSILNEADKIQLDSDADRAGINAAPVADDGRISESDKITLPPPNDTQEFPMLQMPDFPSLYEMINDSHDTAHHQMLAMMKDCADAFIHSFNSHIALIVKLLNDHMLDQLEAALNMYWKTLPSEFLSLLTNPIVSKFVADSYVHFFSAILNQLYSKTIPGIAKVTVDEYEFILSNLDCFMSNSLEFVPESLRNPVLLVTRCFTLSLKLSLSLASSAKKAKFLNTNNFTVNVMLADWRKIDAESINQYVTCVCSWQDGFVEAVQKDMLLMLRRRTTLDNWSLWLNSLILKSIPFAPSSHDVDFWVVDNAAKAFITKFSFYLDQLIQDFTINHVSSFNSWYSLKQFIQEEVWYIVTKNISFLKMSQYLKLGLSRFPQWINGVLIYHLDQRNYFGAPQSLMVRNMSSCSSSSSLFTPSRLSSMPRLPSAHDLYMRSHEITAMPVMSRTNSYDNLVPLPFGYMPILPQPLQAPMPRLDEKGHHSLVQILNVDQQQ